MANPYSILRIQPHATAEQIDEAYYRMRRLASYGEGVKEETLNLAYSILSDPERRARIDEALRKRRPAQGSGVPGAVRVNPKRPVRSRSWLQRLLPFF
jgi:curved DNA-binding protein CbpA